MSFARPDLLWLALVLPAVVAAGIYGYIRRRRRVARLLGEARLVRRLGAGDLARFPARRLLLVTLAAIALGIAAAGPRWGFHTVETRTRSRDLVLALDVSKSMLANDITPNRLERERLFARRLLRELPGDRVGLVAFAGRAYVLSPLTVDHGALQLYLDALDPEIVSQGGSSLAAALYQATDLIRGEPEARHTDRAVILITDGEALEDEGAVIEAAQGAAAAGVPIHAVGIGTAEGAPVPEMDPVTGRIRGYKRDPASGEVVVSRRNDALLARIAEETGGRFVRLERAGATDALLATLSGMDRTEATGTQRVEPRERFAWFVAAALVLLALDTVLERRGAAARGGRRAAAPAELQEA